MSVAATLSRLIGSWPVLGAPGRPAVPSTAQAIEAESADVEEPADIEDDVGAVAPLSDEFDGSLEPGFADLQAAVELVASGIATSVIVSGFRSWPGLLWQVYELARQADVSIVSRSVGAGGRVEIEVTRNATEGG